MRIIFILLLVNILSQNLNSQDKSKINLELYTDIYANIGREDPSNNKLSDYLYSYNRTNELAINLAYLKASYFDTNFRCNFALMTGTYGNDNYAAEIGLFQNLLEGNIGFKLSPQKDVWIDLGVFPSHIGLESYIGYDCYNVTRSLLAENSPYFETGIRYSSNSQNGKWYTAALLLNGWQKIGMNAGYSIPAFGFQSTFKPNDKWTLNYSNFLGSYQPDSMSAIRFYNNLYAIYKPSKKIDLFFNYDIGTDKNTERSFWHGFFCGAKYKFNHSQSLAMRVEYLSDKDNILYPKMMDRWTSWSSSVNFDHKINSFSQLRTEIKYMSSDTPFFSSNEKTNFGVCIAVQVKI